MQRVVSAEEMRWCDETTINTYGVPGLLLMENAGRSVVEIIKQEYSTLESKKVLVVCGKGNNGWRWICYRTIAFKFLCSSTCSADGITF
jgi:NAD(P)H-hydrate repair Nnr-like enzyme with NAD(P)H-hydrate epimerase domain